MYLPCTLITETPQYDSQHDSDSPRSCVEVQFSPIIQTDGNDTPPPTHSPPGHQLCMQQSPTETHPDILAPPPTRVRSASYTLDRPKQIRRLGRDTLAKNFTIRVNKNKENVTIDCNTGFYNTVAIPTLQNLTTSREFSCQGVTVQCQDIVGNFDATQAQQNTVVYFRFIKDRASLGGVRIHLHHTTRRVQLQGGAVMPGEKTSPVWFTEEILEKQFNVLAREKANDISNFNEAVQHMVGNASSISSSPQVCAGCQGLFNGRSSPELCTLCNSFFHKYKCFPSPQHTCYQRRRTQSVSKVPGQVSKPGVFCPDSTQATARTRATTSTSQLSISPHSPTVPHPVPPSNTAATPHPQQTSGISTMSDSAQAVLTTSPTRTGNNVFMDDTDTISINQNIQPATCINQVTVEAFDPGGIPILPVLRSRPGPLADVDLAATETGYTASQDTLIPGTISVLNPNAASFVRDTSTVRVLPEQSQRKTRNNKKNNAVPTDPITIELEFKKVEISTLQTRLQKQEVEIKDIKFRNSILLERNKVLEEEKKRDIHQKYFPTHSKDKSHPCPPPCGDDSNHSKLTHLPCNQAPIIHNHYVSPTCAHQCKLDGINTSTCTNTEVIRHVCDLKDLVEKLTVSECGPLLPPVTANPRTATTSVPADTAQDDSSTPTGEDNSIITLDGFMFNDDGSDNNLN